MAATTELIINAESDTREVAKAERAVKRFLDTVEAGVGIDIGGRLVSSVGEIVNRFKQAVTEGVLFNVTLENAEGQLKTILQQFAPERFGDNAKAIDEVRAAVETLKKEAKETGGTFEDLLNVQTGISGPLFLGGVSDLREQAKIVTAIAAGLTSFQIPQQQLLSEARALVSGNINRNAQLANILGITRQDIDQAREAGDLGVFILEKLNNVITNSAERADTFSRRWERLSDVLVETEADATRELFEQLSQGAVELADAIESPAFKSGLSTLVRDVTTVTRAVFSLGRTAIENADSLALMGKVVLTVAAIYSGFKIGQFTASLIEHGAQWIKSAFAARTAAAAGLNWKSVLGGVGLTLGALAAVGLQYSSVLDQIAQSQQAVVKTSQRLGEQIGVRRGLISSREEAEQELARLQRQREVINEQIDLIGDNSVDVALGEVLNESLRVVQQVPVLGAAAEGLGLGPRASSVFDVANALRNLEAQALASELKIRNLSEADLARNAAMEEGIRVAEERRRAEEELVKVLPETRKALEASADEFLLASKRGEAELLKELRRRRDNALGDANAAIGAEELGLEDLLAAANERDALNPFGDGEGGAEAKRAFDASTARLNQALIKLIAYQGEIDETAKTLSGKLLKAQEEVNKAAAAFRETQLTEAFEQGRLSAEEFTQARVDLAEEAAAFERDKVDESVENSEERSRKLEAIETQLQAKLRGLRAESLQLEKGEVDKSIALAQRRFRLASARAETAAQSGLITQGEAVGARSGAFGELSAQIKDQILNLEELRDASEDLGDVRGVELYNLQIEDLRLGLDQTANSIAESGRQIQQESLAQSQSLRALALSQVQAARQLVEQNPFGLPGQQNAQLRVLGERELELSLQRQLDLKQQIAFLDAQPQTAETVNARLGAQQQLNEALAQEAQLRAQLEALSPTGQVLGGLFQYAQSFGTVGQQVGNILTGTIATGIAQVSSGLSDLVTGTKSWEEVFLDTIDAILQQLVQLVVQMLLVTALQSALGAASGGAGAGAGAGVGLLGGLIGGFALGGLVPGAPSRKDDRLAALAGGEYVVRSPAVQHYGANVFEALNRLAVPRNTLSHLRASVRPSPRLGFAAGGLVGGGGLEGLQLPTPKVTIAITNTEAQTKQAMREAEGQRIIFDAISKRSTELGIRD